MTDFTLTIEIASTDLQLISEIGQRIVLVKSFETGAGNVA